MRASAVHSRLSTCGGKACHTPRLTPAFRTADAHTIYARTARWRWVSSFLADRTYIRTIGESVYTGTLTFDVLLPDHIGSLKAKRSVVRPIVAELRRRFEVSVAEVGHVDLYRRSEIGVAVVSAEFRQCQQVLDTIERHVAERPEIEFLSAHRQMHSDRSEEGDT